MNEAITDLIWQTSEQEGSVGSVVANVHCSMVATKDALLSSDDFVKFVTIKKCADRGSVYRAVQEAASTWSSPSGVSFFIGLFWCQKLVMSRKGEGESLARPFCVRTLAK